jgi:hypothetical protein
MPFTSIGFQAQLILNRLRNERGIANAKAADDRDRRESEQTGPAIELRDRPT